MRESLKGDSMASGWRDLGRLLDPGRRVTSPPPTASEAQWQRRYQLATAHLVAPSLAASLRARGWLPRLPPPLREALEGLEQLNALRHRHWRRVLQDTTRLLNEAGIVPIALKGAIALLPDQSPQAEARVLGDLDLAIAPEQLPTALATLRAAGYRLPENLHLAMWQNNPHHHHAPPLLHPSGDGYVELHRAPLSARVPAEALPLRALAAEAADIDWAGVRLRVPSLRHRLLHNALHHLIQDRAFASDRRALRQLLEFAQLRLLAEPAGLDWAALLDPLERLGVGDALRLSLLSGHELFALPVPPGVRLTPAVIAAEQRFWRRLEDPRFDRALERRWRLRILAERLGRLPRWLITPSWYPAKRHELRWMWRGWLSR